MILQIALGILLGVVLVIAAFFAIAYIINYYENRPYNPKPKSKYVPPSDESLIRGMDMSVKILVYVAIAYSSIIIVMLPIIIFVNT